MSPDPEAVRILNTFDNPDFLETNIRTSMPRAQGLGNFLAFLAFRTDRPFSHSIEAVNILSQSDFDDRSLLLDNYFVGTVDCKQGDDVGQKAESLAKEIAPYFTKVYSASYLPATPNFKVIRTRLEELLDESESFNKHMHRSDL